jgi:hypothetical protein
MKLKVASSAASWLSHQSGPARRPPRPSSAARSASAPRQMGREGQVHQRLERLVKAERQPRPRPRHAAQPLRRTITATVKPRYYIARGSEHGSSFLAGEDSRSAAAAACRRDRLPISPRTPPAAHGSASARPTCTWSTEAIYLALLVSALPALACAGGRRRHPVVAVSWRLR